MSEASARAYLAETFPEAAVECLRAAPGRGWLAILTTPDGRTRDWMWTA